MKFKDFFLNCLNRYSFQFLGYVGIFLLISPLVDLLFCIIYNVDGYTLLSAFFTFALLILPTLGLVSVLSIITIYLKLLHREYKNPNYRIKNKFITLNPVYGLITFIFYIFAVVFIAFILYLISLHLDIYVEVFKYSEYLYPFLIYAFIHIFIICII